MLRTPAGHGTAQGTCGERHGGAHEAPQKRSPGVHAGARHEAAVECGLGEYENQRPQTGCERIEPRPASANDPRKRRRGRSPQQRPEQHTEGQRGRDHVGGG